MRALRTEGNATRTHFESSMQQHRAEVARQITDHAAQVDSRLAAQDTAINEVRRDIDELRRALNVAASARPPPPAPDPSWDREVDPTIVVITSQRAPAKSAVLAALAGMFANASLSEADYQLEGEELSRRYVLRMGGASGLAAMRVRKFLALLHPERNRWERIHCPLPGGAGETTELHMSVDKSPKQVAREIACKKVRLALQPMVPDGKIFVDREDGVLTYKFLPICKVEPSATRRQPPQVYWCDPSLEQLGLQRAALSAAVRAAVEVASVQWSL